MCKQDIAKRTLPYTLIPYTYIHLEPQTRLGKEWNISLVVRSMAWGVAGESFGDDCLEPWRAKESWAGWRLALHFIYIYICTSIAHHLWKKRFNYCTSHHQIMSRVCRKSISFKNRNTSRCWRRRTLLRCSRADSILNGEMGSLQEDPSLGKCYCYSVLDVPNWSI